MIADLAGVNRYILSASVDLWSRGFEVPSKVVAEIDDAGALAFSITGTCPESTVGPVAEVRLAEIWQPVDRQVWERSEYAYDLIDRPRNRRHAWHMHDVRQARATLGGAAHEHCEEVLGRPSCDHYLGTELGHIHWAYRSSMTRGWSLVPLGRSELRCAS